MPDEYTVKIDWDSDGAFTEPHDDVTEDVLDRGIAYSYGRDQARQLSPPAVGRIGFSLCNVSRIYSPENEDSPIVSGGGFLSASPVQLEATTDTDTYALGTGRIEKYSVHPDRSDRSVDIVALDGLGQLSDRDISTGLYQARRTGYLIGVVLDHAGWEGPRDLDLGATFVPWWWVEGTDAFSAIAELLLAEGPPAVAYVAPDGTFVFRDRHHRLLDAASRTSQAVFRAEAVDCSTVAATGTGGVPAGRLVGLDSDATEPTSSSASVTVPSDGTVIEGDLLLLGAAIPTGTGSLSVSSRQGDVFEDFEDADLSIAVTGTWSRTNTESHEGDWCFTSADIGDDETSDADVTVPSGARTVQFWYRVSSESGFDFFDFLIDGVERFFASGEGVWTQSDVFDVSEAQTITFRYEKDGSISEGSDAAFVDDIQFLGSGSFETWQSLGTAVRSGHTSQMWWRLAEEGDLGATVTVTPSVGSVRQVLLLGKVSDVDQDQPIIGSDSFTVASTGSGVTTPTLMGVPVGSREVSAVWDTRGAAAPNTSSWAAPAGQTNQIQAFTTDSDGASSGAMGDSDANVEGTIGGRVWTPDQDAIGSAWTVAVQAAVSQQTALSYTAPFKYEHGARDIINSVSIGIDERGPQAGWEPVWSSEDTISLAIGESRQVHAEARDPFWDALDLEAGTDYITTGPGTLITTLSRRSGQSVTITLLAAGGAVEVTYLQVRARTVPVARMIQVEQDDSVSIQQHGRRSSPVDVPSWIGQHDAFAVGQILLAHYAQRRPLVRMRVASCDTAHREQVLSRTVSDRVTIINGELGMSRDFHIEQVEHTVRRINHRRDCVLPVHAVVLGCEQSGQVAALNPFTFDKAGAGFDDGVFSPIAADNPDRIFIFDHPVQGQFGQGQFAT